MQGFLRVASGRQAVGKEEAEERSLRHHWGRTGLRQVRKDVCAKDEGAYSPPQKSLQVETIFYPSDLKCTFPSYSQMQVQLLTSASIQDFGVINKA